MEGGYYSTGGRMVYMGDKNMLQGFGEESTTAGDASIVKPFNPQNMSHLNQNRSSLAPISDVQESQIEFKEAVDYGRPYYLNLRGVHKERTASGNPSKDELLSTFKILQTSYLNLKSQSQKKPTGERWFDSMAPEKKTKKAKISLETQLRLTGSSFKPDVDISKNKTMALKHELVEGRDIDSVRHTIAVHHDEYEGELELERKAEHGILRKQEELRRKKMEEKLKRKQDKLKDKLKAEDPNAKKPQDQFVTFVKTVKKMHKDALPKDDDYIYPQKLFEFWKSMSHEKKKQNKLELEEKVGLETFHNYFNSRLEFFYQSFKKAKGCQSSEVKVLYGYWKDCFPAREKKEKDLDFETEINAKNMIRDWLDRKEKEDLKKKVLYLTEIHKESATKEKNDKDKKEEKKEVRYDEEGKPMTKKQMEEEDRNKAFEQLAQPKNRLIRGETLIQLKSKYPDDPILRQLLIQEFAEDRVLKRPLEYDQFDSDDEDAIKNRHGLKGHKVDPKDKKDRHNKSVEDKKAKCWITEDQKAVLREKELMEKFSVLSKRYKETKNSEIKHETEVQSVLHKEREKFNDFLETKVAAYKKLVQEKLSKGAVSENKYLSDLYREAHSKFPRVLKAEFPHLKYGESEKLKDISFPMSFKHHFFKLFRALDLNTNEMANNKLGFWAPAGNPISKNEKIVAESKLTKEQQIWETRKK